MSGQTVDYDNYGILLYGANYDANTYVDIRSTTGSNILASVQPPNITYLPGSVNGALSFRINDPTLQGLLTTQGLRFYVVSPTAGYQFAGPLTVVRGSPSLPSQPAAFHSVYFHISLGSFWAALADDTGSPSPRQQMVWSLNNEMQMIRASGIDTITVPLPDNDGWESQHGGGFSYDPVNHPSPQFAVGQEIVLRIAAANNLKVIFVIIPSLYRESTDGRSAWNGLADQYDVTPTTDGALNYIHSLIDPASMYGGVMTTELSTIGLTDGPIGSYYKDPRVLGFILAPELNPEVVSSEGIETHKAFFDKYWNWFYNLVHWNGSNTAFAGLYLIGSPNSPGAAAMVPIIKDFKSWFAPGSGYSMPDLIGIEGYGGAGYPLQNAGADMNVMVDAVVHADTTDYPNDYTISPQKVFIGEANTDELSNPYTNQYYQYMQQLIAKRGLAGVQWFESDTLSDGTPPALGDSGYDLFETSFTAYGTKTFPGTLPSGFSWHYPSTSINYADPTTYSSSTDNFPATWGTISYTAPTAKGYWYGEGISNFTSGKNVVAYAYPNPMTGNSSGLAVTTVYWDATEMPSVITVEIHMNSPNGTLFSGGGAAGSAVTGTWVSKGTTFYVQDVTGGKPLTSANTLAVIYADVQ
ncbi:hypothetical protein GCM10007901_33840 [Dyella acidisoli]|uniref:Uncharacterized protein n=1 Tax=Dyella acidisoli TaxID=1867834 RepID=A0ABQ5XRQ5_9GAMM|nr:hypothetical protein GCM10007901_33840 [Dyella acidisoli]